MKYCIWEDDFFWVTFDVSSFYSSIPHSHVVTSVLFYLEALTDLPLEHRLYIADILEYLLSHNYFVFDGVFYLQRCGAVMGVKFRHLVNLYKGWWERSQIFGDSNPYRSSIAIYLRFIDDLLLVV